MNDLTFILVPGTQAKLWGFLSNGSLYYSQWAPTSQPNLLTSGEHRRLKTEFSLMASGLSVSAGHEAVET